MSPTIQARAEAAAKEISIVWSLISVDRPCGCDECTTDMAAIIARHFADLARLRAAAERAEKAEVDRAWEELKRIGCSNPETAVRVIMVTKEMLSTALRAALTPDAAADGTKEKNL